MKRGWVFLVFLLINISYISATILFESEWNNSLGNSTTALRDGTIWDAVPLSSNVGVLEVIPSSNLDFPTANVVKITALDRGDGGALAQNIVMQDGNDDIPGLLNDGDDIFYRWYERVDAPEPYPSTDDLTHGIENGNANQNWLRDQVVNDDGTWLLRWSFEGTANPNNRISAPLLQKDKTYLVELNIHRLSSATFNAHAKIYHSNGTLLYDDDDFTNVGSSQTLADNPVLTFVSSSVMDELQVGFNGLQVGGGINSSNDEFVHGYIGGFAVCDTTWCGAYGAASNNPADFDADNIVNKTDILKIIYWILGIDRTNSAVDLDNNGAVNIFDLVNASRLFGKQYGTDSTAPSIVSSRPTNNTNLSAGTTQTVLFAETNERATCRYLNTTGGSFATMNNFTRTGRVSHSIQLTGLTGGTTYNYYIQCQDEALNLNSTNYHVRFGIDSSDTPSYNVGTDYLIYSDIFDAYVSPDDRHTQLLSLRGSQGSNHDIFLSDNRPADSHAAVEAADPTFYTRYNITSPGIGGAGRALRSTYLGSTSPNQAIAWITWPVSQQKYYNGNHGNLVERNATHVINVKFKVISEGWDVEWPGWKFFELWYDTQSNRAQGSVVPAGSTGDLGGQTSGWWRPNIGGTEYGSYVNDFARWEDVNNDNSTWHDLLILYKASDTSGDGTGRFRGWVDGVLAWDISPDGISSGYATQAAVNAIATNHIYFLKFPDTLNTNTQAQNAVIDYDNLTWWVENS